MFFIIAEYIKNLYKKNETSSYTIIIQANYSTQEELDDLV
jgi:hypothetical protein